MQPNVREWHREDIENLDYLLPAKCSRRRQLDQLDASNYTWSRLCLVPNRKKLRADSLNFSWVTRRCKYMYAHLAYIMFSWLSLTAERRKEHAFSWKPERLNTVPVDGCGKTIKPKIHFHTISSLSSMKSLFATGMWRYDACLLYMRVIYQSYMFTHNKSRHGCRLPKIKRFSHWIIILTSAIIELTMRLQASAGSVTEAEYLTFAETDINVGIRKNVKSKKNIQKFGILDSTIYISRTVRSS